jgi:hypothetical protein
LPFEQAEWIDGPTVFLGHWELVSSFPSVEALIERKKLEVYQD